MSLSVYTHVCTHTHKYIANIYIGKMRRKFPASRQGLPRGKKIMKFTETLHLFQSAPIPDSDVSPVLAAKSRTNLVAFMLTNMS